MYHAMLYLHSTETSFISFTVCCFQYFGILAFSFFWYSMLIFAFFLYTVPCSHSASFYFSY